jgi:hypothetical protein
MDKIVNECLNYFENNFGTLSNEWDFGDAVSMCMSKILRICRKFSEYVNPSVLTSILITTGANFLDLPVHCKMQDRGS